MSDAPKQNLARTCADCRLWPAGTQSGIPTQEKIQLCINRILADRRQWITAEEFLAQVEAQRQARLKAPLKATKPFYPGPAVRIYVLDYFRMFVSERPKLITPEDMP